MNSSELLLLFSFVSLAPVILFGNHTIQALRGSDRVGIESRWGGIGGGGGGWGLTRPATWLMLTLFFSLLAAVLIGATAERAAEVEERRDGLVLEINRRALQAHESAFESLKSAESDAEKAAALASLELALASHRGAVSSLETLWGAQAAKDSEKKEDDKKGDDKKEDGETTGEAVSPKPEEEIQDLNPRAVEQ